MIEDSYSFEILQTATRDSVDKDKAKELYYAGILRRLCEYVQIGIREIRLPFTQVEH